jgi:hypothetical protein
MLDEEGPEPPRGGDPALAARSRERLTENLRKIAPPHLEPSEFAREFLDRYMADDRRVVGVRFGPTTIEVQVTDRSAMNDLPAAFHGVPVVLRDFPQRGPGPGRAAAGHDAPRPGPLADL